jgi:Bax protein
MISYRKKLIDLAKIYRIKEVALNQNNLTTTQIEVILLKKKIPIPSGKGLIAIKINNFKQPFINNFKKIDNFFRLTKKNINFLIIKKFKNFYYIINLFFHSIGNLFSYIGGTIVDLLNNFYNFKVKEDIFNKLISRAGIFSLLIIVAVSLFYLKEFVINLDSVKISLEIKSDKSNKNQDTKLKIVKVPKKTEQEVKVENTKKIEPKKKKPVIKKNELAKIPQKKDETTKTLKQNPNSFGLNTETVLNLFEDLEYDLDKVRSQKKVKPIFFTRFPEDLNSIGSVNKKKETFIKIILPLVLAENKRIFNDRQKLKKIMKKRITSDKEKAWLKQKLREYKVKKGDMDELYKRIDIIPNSIALAQAAKESGWGTSRFALEGNAIFGQWTWSEKGIEPLNKEEGESHKILKFPILRASVKAYITNLNTHKSYKEFRDKRGLIREKNKSVKGLDLIHQLQNYAQTGKEYTKTLEKIIVQNDLDDFENAELIDNDSRKELTL